MWVGCQRLTSILSRRGYLTVSKTPFKYGFLETGKMKSQSLNGILKQFFSLFMSAFEESFSPFCPCVYDMKMTSTAWNTPWMGTHYRELKLSGIGCEGKPFSASLCDIQHAMTYTALSLGNVTGSTWVSFLSGLKSLRHCLQCKSIFYLHSTIWIGCTYCSLIMNGFAPLGESFMVDVPNTCFLLKPTYKF